MKTSTLIGIQVVVAVLAIGATVGAARELAPTARKLIDLQSEVTQLEEKKKELQFANAALAANASPIAPASANDEGWLYLGRVNSDKAWAPAAEGVTPSPDNSATDNIQVVAVTKNARYVADVDSPIVDVKDFKPSANKGPVRLVAAGTSLDVLETKRQPSAGGASYVWVKVVGADRKLTHLQR